MSKSGTPRILIIQTAFIGDVVLALPVFQQLRKQWPEAELHALVREGNETLLAHHPAVDHIWTWHKQGGKYIPLFHLIRKLRRYYWDYVFNLHRFASSGLVTALLSARTKVGFDKNPFSCFYTHRFPHRIPWWEGNGYRHEVDRNLQLLTPMFTPVCERPRLYPDEKDRQAVENLQKRTPYYVLAAASVWHTKQWPAAKWKALMQHLPKEATLYLVGSAADRPWCRQIAKTHAQAVNCCGELTFLQTAALMEKAQAVVSNDSAPLHFASAVNAPTVAIFCSTVPAFGFGPLAEHRRVVEHAGKLDCRPCGLHGYRKCPEGHFKCAEQIAAEKVFAAVKAVEGKK